MNASSTTEGGALVREVEGGGEEEGTMGTGSGAGAKIGTGTGVGAEVGLGGGGDSLAAGAGWVILLVLGTSLVDGGFGLVSPDSCFFFAPFF